MALQVYSAAPRTSMVHSSGPQGMGIMNKQSAMVCVAADYPQLMKRKERGLSMSFRVRAGSDAAAAAAEVVAEVGKVTEVNVDTFWPIVKAAGDKTVVVDMYTQWWVYHLSSQI